MRDNLFFVVGEVGSGRTKVAESMKRNGDEVMYNYGQPKVEMMVAGLAATMADNMPDGKRVICILRLGMRNVRDDIRANIGGKFVYLSCNPRLGDPTYTDVYQPMLDADFIIDRREDVERWESIGNLS